ncbi:MAG: hypothetical protein LBH59_10795 [Planctomycetaceae bacterium]|jgi:hypothetical protein|nr:hypothetical protein [Planctomycetaceae bacterium]
MATKIATTPNKMVIAPRYRFDVDVVFKLNLLSEKPQFNAAILIQCTKFLSFNTENTQYTEAGMGGRLRP